MTSKKVTPEQLVERFEKELEGWRDEHSSLLPTEKLKNFTELALGQTISEDTYQAKKRASRLLIRLWAACPKVFLLCALFSNMTDLGRMRVDDCAETLENWWNGDSTHDSHQGLTETFDEAARRGLLPNQQTDMCEPRRPDSSPISTSPIRPTSPPISASFECADEVDIPDHNLTESKIPVYEELLQRLKNTKESLKTCTKVASRNRIKQEQQAIAAAIGLLSVMDDGKFEHWLAGNVPESFFVMHATAAGSALSDWLQKPGNRYEKSTIRRSRETLDAQATVPAWYGYKCVLTGNGGVEACHIVPSCIERDGTRAKEFWAAIKSFWPPTWVSTLERLLQEPDHEMVNLLVLDPTSHRFWSKTLFALRPLDDSEAQKLHLQFFWIKSIQTDNKVFDYSRDEAANGTLCDHRNSDGRTSRILQSGDILHIKTRNSKVYPLPDSQLLQLQWHLHRAARAAGNAGFLRLIFDHDPDSTKVPATDNAHIDVDEAEFGSPGPYGSFPHFTEYLIDSARDLGIIRESHAPFWRQQLISPGAEDVDDLVLPVMDSRFALSLTKKLAETDRSSIQPSSPPRLPWKPGNDIELTFGDGGKNRPDESAQEIVERPRRLFNESSTHGIFSSDLYKRHTSSEPRPAEEEL